MRQNLLSITFKILPETGIGHDGAWVPVQTALRQRMVELDGRHSTAGWGRHQRDQRVLWLQVTIGACRLFGSLASASQGWVVGSVTLSLGCRGYGTLVDPDGTHVVRASGSIC